MKYKELIEKIEALPAHNARNRPWIDKKLVLGLVRELDEPQKPVVPQFVAEWIEACSKNLLGFNLKSAMNINTIMHYSENHNKLINWINLGTNQELFARAWLDGYEVEKEKRYLVKVKGHIHENILVYGYGIKRYFFSSNIEGNRRAHHTRKELEEAGFGWVFDCEGVEVEEVTE